MPNKNNFISFELSREFVRSLSLKSKAEWVMWVKSGNRQKNVLLRDCWMPSLLLLLKNISKPQRKIPRFLLFKEVVMKAAIY